MRDARPTRAPAGTSLTFGLDLVAREKAATIESLGEIDATFLGEDIARGASPQVTSSAPP